MDPREQGMKPYAREESAQPVYLAPPTTNGRHNEHNELYNKNTQVPLAGILVRCSVRCKFVLK